MKLVTRNLLYRKVGTGPTPPGPSIVLPPDDEIWYEASSQITANIGSPISHTFDSETGRGVLKYSSTIFKSSVVASNALRGNDSMTKVWWPHSCANWSGDCMHSCTNLKEIYAGRELKGVSDGTCNSGTTPDHITLVDNDYFYENNTGLVLKSNNRLLLGTYNLDIRNTPCTTLGSRCMADMYLQGATLYFPDTMTGSVGDWNIGSSNTRVEYTVYLPCSQAPSWPLNYIRGTITWHIPTVNTGYTTWTYVSNWTIIEDL